MAGPIKSVAEMVDEAAPGTDILDTYNDLRALIAGLFSQIEQRFALTRDPISDSVEDYGSAVPGGPTGSIHAYSGPEIDWAVHSWLASPDTAFTNIHLTVWLGPQIDVPHLGIAFGTLPHVWSYIDYVPRRDLMVDLDYLDRYYEPVNEEHLEVLARPGIEPFTSKSLYVRQSLSETAHCFYCMDQDQARATVHDIAERHVQRWLDWVDQASPVPAEEQAALAARDLHIRRTIAERDPANVMGVRYFGEELTDTLVKTLWGGNRTLPRPAGS